MTITDFVESCYARYRLLGLTPGDPLCGEWEAAHHPLPKCKGGTEVIWLLKNDHAVHNLLQSEELGHPCVYGWEREYVSEEYSEMAERWISAQRSLAGQSGDPEGKAVGGRKVGALNRERGTNNLPREVLVANAMQVWESTVDGFRANAGNVAKHNKVNGWDPAARVRVS